MNFDSTYVKIDLDAIRGNLRAVKEKTGVPVMAVVKADAYGHGAVQVARHLQEDCAFFGVSSMLEALELRQAGLVKPILILGRTPVSAFPHAVREEVRTTIFHYEDALALSQEAQRQGKTAYFHIAVDTGMSRIGLQPAEEAVAVCEKMVRLPNLVAEGIFSHYATADCGNLGRARAQAQRFEDFLRRLEEKGICPRLRHMDNSAGLMNFSTKYELVRSGIVTYGLYPSGEVTPALLPLTPALQWLSRVTHVKELPAGREISYGGTYVTRRPTVVATVPVGYADGYRRSLSGRFYVLIHGKRAPILGRICMDQLMVDVTDIPGVKLDDTVTLVGRDGGECIAVEEIAAAADSFNYEFICGISRRVPRIYCQGGKEVRSVHYLLDT